MILSKFGSTFSTIDPCGRCHFLRFPVHLGLEVKYLLIFKAPTNYIQTLILLQWVILWSCAWRIHVTGWTAVSWHYWHPVF